MAHIAQLTIMTAPTKSAKQYAPKRTIILGSARCVMPKTTDVNSAKSSIAEK
jgi:hypothetical protein